MVLRKILGVFKTSPILPKEVEAALAPPQIRLDTATRNYAFRLSKLSITHPVNTEINQNILVPRLTQLKRVKKYLLNNTDGSQSKQIKHFTFPPWSAELPFIVHIKENSKEIAAAHHHEEFQNSDWGTTTFIYTDASCMEESKGVGVGVIATDHQGTLVEKLSINIREGNLVYNGELEGITQGIEYASLQARPGNRFCVFPDNQAALMRLAKLSYLPGQAWQIRAIAAAKKIKEKEAKISLSWLPGHSRIDGNEKADELAKKASKLAPLHYATSFT